MASKKTRFLLIGGGIVLLIVIVYFLFSNRLLEGAGPVSPPVPPRVPSPVPPRVPSPVPPPVPPPVSPGCPVCPVCTNNFNVVDKKYFDLSDLSTLNDIQKIVTDIKKNGPTSNNTFNLRKSLASVKNMSDSYRRRYTDYNKYGGSNLLDDIIVNGINDPPLDWYNKNFVNQKGFGIVGVFLDDYSWNINIALGDN
jgi:hypothetical protein